MSRPHSFFWPPEGAPQKGFHWQGLCHKTDPTSAVDAQIEAKACGWPVGERPSIKPVILLMEKTMAPNWYVHYPIIYRVL